MTTMTAAPAKIRTDVEQRMEDGRQLSCPRERINRIMEERFYEKKPHADIQRAVLFTESMRRTENLPKILEAKDKAGYLMSPEEVDIMYQGKSTAGGHEGYTHFEALSLGGQTPAGQDATNDLTYLILRS